MDTIKRAVGIDPLPTRQLGRNGPKVTGLGLGLMGISVAYGPALPTEERLKFLDKAYELGEWFWDTADMYGDSEDVIGQWFKLNPSKRKDIFLASKFANKWSPGGELSVDSSAEYCKAACAKSLERLGVDHIDLYYCHRLDKKTPIEQTVRAMKELKDEGKIKYLGLSECSSTSLRRACAVSHISAVQMEYSPFALEVESEQYNLLATARELGVALVAYSPIGRGMLSGQFRSPSDFGEGDFRRIAPRFSEENFPKNLVLVDEISALAKEHGVTPTQLTLAWLLAQGDDIFPIPGTTKAARLEENLQALKIKLSAEEERKIRMACEAVEVAGQRYPGAMGGALFADTPEE